MRATKFIFFAARALGELTYPLFACWPVTLAVCLALALGGEWHG